MFLDEPTSGLDSSSANSIMQLLKKLAENGRIVVLSVHQPSTKSFMLLDKVMLLAKGRLMYDGSSSDTDSYFESMGFQCPKVQDI